MMSIFNQEESVEMYGKRMAREGKIMAFYEMVQKGLITAEQAAETLSMTVEKFKEAVEQLMVTA